MPNPTPTKQMHAVVQQALETIPECLAAAVVDTQMGILLAHASNAKLAEEILDMMVMALARQLRGRAVLDIENALGQTEFCDPVTGRHFLEELMLFSRQNIHLIQRLGSSDDLFFVTVCPQTAPIGMVLFKTRQARTAVNNALP